MEKIREKVIHDLFKGTSQSLGEFLKSNRKKIFFGQGAQAFICYDICHRLGIKVEVFLGSENSYRMPTLPMDIPFYTLDQSPDEIREYDVLIAVNEKLNNEVKKNLLKHGFINIYYSDNWNRTNDEYRTSFYHCFLEQEMGDAFSPENEIIEWDGFRIWSGVNQPEEYRSMFMGDFFDIIAPSIYHNEEYIREGGYEDWGGVFIERDDIVFDLGANIGMFSCVAASKGKKVYAFEPTPGTMRLLEKQTLLYGNLICEEYAVSNQVGTCVFTINSMTTEDVNTGRNTMMSERLEGIEGICQIEVKTITIDEFVKQEKLANVDFIKADVEGAERYMLEGAKETLARFSPKLSLCTYHLPDDPEVLERLILQYNPNYIIKQGEKKLWAYVPKQK